VAEGARSAGQTFGLKNKNKSKKVAKYVNELQKQVNPQKKRGPEDDKTAAKVPAAVVAARLESACGCSNGAQSLSPLSAAPRKRRRRRRLTRPPSPR